MPTTELDDLLAGLALSESSAEFVKSLPSDQQQQLLSLLQSAVQKKDERINGAVNNALSVVPLPLRGTVKKMLFS
ncbi:MAG: hypothetical protein P1U67_05855 [Alcanivoracaceae bacterium]|nr:hypothetical protein [Alcanivoracaceae bacterium]